MILERVKVRTFLKTFSESWWPIVVIALLVGFFVYQRWEMIHPHPREVVKKGDRLPPVRLETADAKPVYLDWAKSGTPTVLYVFEPQCVWCQRNRQAVSVLQQAVSGYRLIGLSLKREGLADFLRGGPPFEGAIYIVPDKARKLLKLSRTPETIMVSADGVIAKIWPGAYTGRTKVDLEKTFRFSLPALAITSTPDVQ